MREYHDLIIVGAGAAGNAIAKDIENIDTLVIEKKKAIGNPVECAGLISNKTLDILNLNPDDVDFVQNKIYGAYVHSPKGETYQIGGDKIHAYAIDRAEFDRCMARLAESKGVNYLLDTKVEDLSRSEEGIIVKTKDKEFECKLLIGADGVDSIVRRTFFDIEPEEILFGIGAELENVNIDPRYVHIFFGNKLAKGFFAWLIPTDKNGERARTGLCTIYPLNKSPKNLLHDLFNYPTTRQFLENTEVINIIAGRIPLGYADESTKNNILLIGDSAFQVKPLSGGGIYPISVSSRICLSILKEAFERKDFDRSFLDRYHKEWSAKLKKEIAFGMWVRKRFRNMKDDDIEKFLSYLKREDILDIVNRYGDIDHPSKLILPLAKKFPTLISILPKLIGLFF